jgi:hypothetical protein
VCWITVQDTFVAFAKTRRNWEDPSFIAFDLLYLNGRDLRPLPLVERKTMLERLIRRKRARMFYLDHVESDGCLLFEQVRKMDLEGIVCKRKDSPYKVAEKPSQYWIKVKNSRYSQLEGREELFETWLTHRIVSLPMWFRDLLRSHSAWSNHLISIGPSLIPVTVVCCAGLSRARFIKSVNAWTLGSFV